MSPVRPTWLHHQSLMLCNSIIYPYSVATVALSNITPLPSLTAMSPTTHHHHHPHVMVMPTWLLNFLPLQLFYFCSTTAANHLIFIPLPRLATLFLFHCYSYTTNHPPLLFPLAHIIHCLTLSSHLTYHGPA